MYQGLPVCLSVHVIGYRYVLIQDQLFSLIILDEWDRYGMSEAFLSGKYEKVGILFNDKHTMLPKSGYRTRPQWIFLPKLNQ